MKATLYALLAIVASAAAVLSFAGLRALAELCGFSGLSWLLPLVIDAGAAAGTVAWLGAGTAKAARLGRNLALVLLAASVAFNVLSHALTAYALAPSWWLIGAVAAVSPAVLAAVIHLAHTLATAVPDGPAPSRELPVDDLDESDLAEPDVEEQEPTTADEPWAYADAVAWAAREGAGSKRIQSHTGLSEHHAKNAARDAKDQKQLRVAR